MLLARFVLIHDEHAGPPPQHLGMVRAELAGTARVASRDESRFAEPLDIFLALGDVNGLI